MKVSPRFLETGGSSYWGKWVQMIDLYSLD